MAVAIPIIAIAAVGALSAGVAAYGDYKQAKTEEKAANANARIERRNAYARERAARRSGMLQVRRQQLGVQAGGLLATGSPLELLANNTSEVEYRAISERNAGLNAASYMRWTAREKRKAASANIWTAALMGGLGGAARGIAGGGAAAVPATGTGLLAPNNSAGSGYTSASNIA